MDPGWIVTSWRDVGMVVVSAVGIYVLLIALTRVVGLRSFSKMSSFDFAMTVAIGSLIATTIVSPSPPLLQAAAALATLYGLQLGLAVLRQRMGWVQGVVDNRPVLLMEDGRVLDDALRGEEITRADLMAKLREANVLDLGRVHAVILETTGDISVLHGDRDRELAPELLENVRRY